MPDAGFRRGRPEPGVAAGVAPALDSGAIGTWLPRRAARYRARGFLVGLVHRGVMHVRLLPSTDTRRLPGVLLEWFALGVTKA